MRRFCSGTISFFNNRQNVQRKTRNAMKKILLTVAGSMFIALATVNAQERSDTTRSRTNEPSDQYRPADKQSGTQAETGTLEGRSGTQGQYWRDEDRVSITSDQLPEDLLKTLEGDEYKGWENATIYRHKASNDYMLVIQDNGEVKTFYFDQEGKAKTYEGVDDQTMGQDQNQDQNAQYRNDQTSGMTQTDQPQWRDEDKVMISTSQIPSAMLITLGDPKYKGWDKSKVYRNKTSNDYMIEISDGTTTRTYYFDQSGNAKEYGSGTGNNDDQSYRNENQTSGQTQPSDSQQQTTSSGAIGTSQVGDDDDAARDDNDDNYSLNRSSTQGPVQTDQPSQQWRTEDRVVVTSSEIPASLRMTLSGDEKYKGWENSTIYRNRTSNDYMIEVRDGSTSNTYYFDSEGRAKESGTTDDNDDQSSLRDNDDDNDVDAEKDSHDGGRSGYSSTEEKVPTGAKTAGTTGQYSQWRDEDRVMITSSEVPVSLRTTLSDKKYTGWEKSTIYRNKATNEYLVEIRDGSDVKTYYFDKDGKAIVINTEEDQD
jgi:hypothetical protein